MKTVMAVEHVDGLLGVYRPKVVWEAKDFPTRLPEALALCKLL